MKVLMPNEYPIEFEQEEINTIKDALAVLNTITKEMENNSCSMLEGGYVESPTEFHYEDFCEVKEFLKIFINDVPYKMY